MKRLLVTVALGSTLVGPAFAQHDPDDPNDPNTHRRIHAFEQQQSKVPVHAGDNYYGRNNNLNPDLQIGGSWWRRHQRKHARGVSIHEQK
jgi:hypothetical protein